jgi:cytochrome c-type biogenesis protein CcmH/NrfG
MSEKKPLQQILILFSAFAFLGSTVFGLVGLFGNAQQTSTATETAANPQIAQLENQAKGYELVLQREPENQTALQGLVQARLEIGDLQGAVAPLEKLVETNPEQESYKALLAAVKQQVGEGSQEK